MLLFKNEECSSYLHDLIVSVMEQWAGNKEQGLRPQLPSGAVKGSSGSRVSCEILTECHQAHPLRDLGAGHHRPGQQRDNGATLATLPWQVSTRRLGLTAPLVTKIAPIWWYLWVGVWPRKFRTVFSDIVRIKVKARSWNLLLSYFNITPFWKIKLQSILSTDHFS